MIGSALSRSVPATAPAAADATLPPGAENGPDTGVDVKFAALLGGLARRVAPGKGDSSSELAIEAAPPEAGAAEAEQASSSAPHPDAELAALRSFVLSVAQPAASARPPAPLSAPHADTAMPLTPRNAAVSDTLAADAGTVPGVTIASDAEIVLPPAPHGADLRPVRDLALLHPRLRIRVERVIARMANEHGHEVRVIETLRSQARQDHLHAQGRTRPGEVVTWTTHSKHTEGLAADLMVDGGWSDPVAYERLQRIAREEGLATLGSRDPGHVELKRAVQDAPARGQLPADLRAAVSATQFARPRGATARVPSMAGAPTPPTATHSAGIASAAELDAALRPAAPTAHATVATVAEPARVASVATVAPPASPRPARRASDDVSGTEVPADASSGSGRSAVDIAMPQRSDPRFTGAPPTAAAPSAPLAASDRAERAEKIEQLLDLRASRPLQSLTLRVADANGTDHRIRVDLRGGQVAADIALADPARVSPLLSRLPELAQRLGDRGYDAGALQVRALTTDAAPPGTPGDHRSTSDDRPQHQGQQHHHSQSRHRGRRDPGGEAQ